MNVRSAVILPRIMQRLLHRIAPGLILATGFSAGGLLAADERTPEVKTVQPGVRLTLVAEHPDIATPTGIDVDDTGRVWVVACHTHMPPEDYEGPDRDEILVFDREGGRTVFYDATHHTMDLELGPDGWVYLAERDRIVRIRDTDGDGRADREENLAVLETEADYPHNGLSGLGWHPDGDLVFGLGENYAKGWTLTDREGRAFTGFGEGGVFRCRPDGTGLHRLARGMWNPFGLCVRDDGEIFVTDNDPGERPPCRLLHIVEGGDYGYQRIYGGAAHHPFVCWNGELRGTLPMVHPTGEAPCGIAPFAGGFLVPSWSDHRLDFLPVRREGASFAAERIALVRGGRYFRPTCIAADESGGENGSGENVATWYLSDWVDGRYPVHGYGRLWRLEVDAREAADWMGSGEGEAATGTATVAAALRGEEKEFDSAELFLLARHGDPFVARAALLRLSREAADWSPEDLADRSETDRIHSVLALKLGEVDPADWVPALLQDGNPDVVFETLRWVSDARSEEFLPRVEKLLARSDLDFEVFEAAMAAWNTLSGAPEKGVRDEGKLLARVKDENSSSRLRAYALRLLPSPARQATKSDPAARLRYPKGLTVDLLEELIAVGDLQLSLEAVRVLAGAPAWGSPVLARLAKDEGRSARLRAEALAGLTAMAGEHLQTIVALAGSGETSVREEALRLLRSRPLDEGQEDALRRHAERFPGSADLYEAVLDPPSLVQGRPPMEDVDAWLERIEAVEGKADPAAGGRIFHHASLALCANCHRHEGRGNVVGPDLSEVKARGDRRWLLESILRPGLEIAPEYLPRTITLKDGTSATGIRLRSSVREALRDARGRNMTFHRDDIASIEELSTSFMPAGLVYTLTDRELRDLLAFLAPQDGDGAP